MRVSCLVLSLFIVIPGVLPNSACAAREKKEAPVESRYANQRGGEWKKYEGNPKWDENTVYADDKDLGTPDATPPQFGPWVNVEGRNVRTVTRGIARDQVFLGEMHRGLPFVGLEDDKGKVILPCVFEQIVVTPGQGVLLQSYLRPAGLERYAVKTGARTPIPNLFRIQEQHENGVIRFYLHITDLKETVQATRPRLNTEQRVGTRTEAAKTAPALPMEMARLDVFDASGEIVKTFDRVAPIADTYRRFYRNATGRGESLNMYRIRLGKWWVISIISPTGERCMQLLDLHFQPVGDPFPQAVPSGPTGLIIPSPFGHDLWLPITEQGNFASFPGTIGIKPLSRRHSIAAARELARVYESVNTVYSDFSFENGSEAQRHFWLVAYATPEGLRWGYMDPKTKALSGPLWKDVQHLQTDVLIETYSHFGGVVAVQQMDDSWHAVPAHSSIPKVEPRAYRTLAELIDVKETDALKRKAENTAKMAQEQHWLNVTLPQLRREARWQDAWLRGEWGTIATLAYAWGGDFFVKYADEYYAATGYELRKAAELTADAAKKADFERRATAADERVKREAAERARQIALQEQNANRKESTYSPNWSSWSNWSAARTSTPDYSSQMKAMNDYVYGSGRASSNPVPNTWLYK